jgi:molybdopterin-guanine dinucleotide biosynthesis protein A
VKSGGIVLCGGKSRRMGRPKPMLPFGAERMLQRVVRLVAEAVDTVVVVAAAGQALPPLAPAVRVARDRSPDRGPLEGIRAGLQAMGDQADLVFVTGCDVPLLVPGFIRRMIELAADFDVAVPHVRGRDEPLSAVYRTGVLRQVERLLAADRLRPAFLFDQVRARRVTAEELADVDPELQSLANVNTPAEYQAALARAGFPAPSDNDE